MARQSCKGCSRAKARANARRQRRVASRVPCLEAGFAVEKRRYKSGTHAVTPNRRGRSPSESHPADLKKNGEGGLVATKKFQCAICGTKSPASRLDRRAVAIMSLRRYPSCNRRRSSPERIAIALHEELAITPTWRDNCPMVRSGQPTGVLIPVV
jgi:hypothetical protein